LQAKPRSLADQQKEGKNGLRWQNRGLRDVATAKKRMGSIVPGCLAGLDLSQQPACLKQAGWLTPQNHKNLRSLAHHFKILAKLSSALEHLGQACSCLI